MICKYDMQITRRKNCPEMREGNCSQRRFEVLRVIPKEASGYVERCWEAVLDSMDWMMKGDYVVVMEFCFFTEGNLTQRKQRT